MPEAPMRIEVSYTTSAWFDSKFWSHKSERDCVRQLTARLFHGLESYKVGSYLLEQKKLHSVGGDNCANYALELGCPVTARG